METFAIPTEEENHSETTFSLLNGHNQSNLGLLVLSAEFQVTYINQEAQRMMDHLKSHSKGPLLSEDLPPGIISMIDNLLGKASHTPPKQQFSTVQCRRITGPFDYPVLLRGFVFPQDARILSCHFLVIMEKLGKSPEKGSPKGIKFPKRYGLTERQKTIVKYVTAGLTNKQIAEELGISVYTVKEHIKHVMRKTETNTRTAAIARLTRRKPLKLHAIPSSDSCKKEKAPETEEQSLISQSTN